METTMWNDEGQSHWLARAMGVVFCSLVLGSAQAASDDGNQRSGDKLYAQVCSLCHATGVGPVLLGRSLPPPLALYVVRNGRNGMPAFRSTEITDAELNAVAQYIATAPAPAGAAEKKQ
jgi:mono/diheme cytochrome c family protein